MNNANSFFVKYGDGTSTTMTSSCESVEAFCNEHFGSSWDIAKEHGATVTMNADAPTAEAAAEQPAPEEQPATAVESAPATHSVLQDIRDEATDLLHKAEHALGMDDGKPQE
jgi:hypothetical protein